MGEMKGKLNRLYDTNIMESEGNVEVAFEQYLAQIRTRRSEVANFLREKREKFKVGAEVGEVEA